MLSPLRVLIVGAGLGIAFPTIIFAQATIATGDIQGTISDPSGSRIAGAKVSISSKVTGQTFTVSTNPVGTYSSGALIPGRYILRVEVSGFKTMESPVVVQVGVTSSGNITLQIGEAKEVIRVEGLE